MGAHVGDISTGKIPRTPLLAPYCCAVVVSVSVALVTVPVTAERSNQIPSSLPVAIALVVAAPAETSDAFESPASAPAEKMYVPADVTTLSDGRLVMSLYSRL